MKSQTLFACGFKSVRVVHEIDSNQNYIGTSTKNLAGETMERFPTGKSSKLDKQARKQSLLYEHACEIFNVSSVRNNGRPKELDEKKRLAAEDIAKQCCGNSMKSLDMIAAELYPDYCAIEIE